MADRYTSTQQVQLVTDAVELARREAENGIRQANFALEIIRSFVKDRERPFKLRQGLLLQLNAEALRDIHALAGTYRNGPAKIHGSSHTPPPAFRVADEIADMCEYVNAHWADKSALHLAAYTLWRVNWVHPFADGNGRTARAISYVVLSVKIDGLLPGTKSIPDQIADDKTPYYDALEKADAVWKAKSEVDVTALEEMLGAMLANQLLQAAKEAETVRPE
jgi:Fic family protein